MLALWLVAAALAAEAPLVAGERLDWAISWMGISAGSAWSTTSKRPAGWVFEAGAKSAGWLASMYPIDDLLRSEWTPHVGSSRHVTRFREGRFEQDSDIRFTADAVVVARTQRFDEGPRRWEDRYAAAPGAEDPVSAFYRLREEAGPVGERVRYQVWTGRKSIPMVVWTTGVELYDGQPSFRVEVLTDHGNEDVEPKMTVWITDNAARVPLAALVRSRAGPVKATLVKRTLP